MNDALSKYLEKNGVIAVLEIEDVKDAVPVCKALVEGGIHAIELALRTPAAEPSIELIRKGVPDMCVGIGTVIKPGQAIRVKELGAHFAVSPGFNPRIVEEAFKAELPFAPGIATPSELESAVEMGCSILKFFPAVPMGGVSYLKSMNGPYGYLGLRFVPLGGVSLDNLEEWASYKPVISVGGTWIAKKEIIRAGEFNRIRENASKAVEVWNKARGM